MKKILSIWLALAAPAQAQLNVSISGAQQEPIPVAFPEILSDNQGIGAFLGFSYASKVRDVVLADLERSGLFRIINERSYIQKFTSFDQQPIFGDWKVLNAQVLVQSYILEENGSDLKLRFKLWDIVSQKELLYEVYSSSKDNWRRMAHSMADAIYERLTGDKGYFNTVIAYISESGPSGKRVKRLALMDQDGDGHQFLTSGANLVLTPRFSPDMQYIAYLSYVNNKPRVYLYNLRTQRTELLGNFPGMTFAPAFSPDSKYLLMSYAKNGVTDIMLDLLEFERSDKILEPVMPDGTGYGKICELPIATHAKALAECCKKAFDCTVVRYTETDRPIKRVAVCSGAGGSTLPLAAAAGCDALITGDIKHDVWIDAVNRDFCLIDAGHFHTENILCNYLCGVLSRKFHNTQIFVAQSSKDPCSYII